MKRAYKRNGKMIIKFTGSDFKKSLEVVKKLFGFTFSKATKLWTGPATQESIDVLEKSGFLIAENLIINNNIKLPSVDFSGLQNLRRYQKDGVAFAEANNGRIINADEMGCVVGSTIITINRGGGARKQTIESAWKGFNRLYKKRPQYNWDRSIQTRCRAWNSDRDIFIQHDVVDIVCKGERPTCCVTTESGKTITLTYDHKLFFKNIGWRPIGKADIGEKILVNGTPICKLCGSTENVSTYKKAKYRGYCRKCIYNKLRRGTVTGIERRLDSDGYVYLVGTDVKDYPRNKWFPVP